MKERKKLRQNAKSSQNYLWCLAAKLDFSPSHHFHCECNLCKFARIFCITTQQTALYSNIHDTILTGHFFIRSLLSFSLFFCCYTSKQLRLPSKSRQQTNSLNTIIKIGLVKISCAHVNILFLLCEFFNSQSIYWSEILDGDWASDDRPILPNINLAVNIFMFFFTKKNKILLFLLLFLQLIENKTCLKIKWI